MAEPARAIEPPRPAAVPAPKVRPPTKTKALKLAPTPGAGGPGTSLPQAIARQISRSLRVDVSAVRVHTDAAAAAAAKSVGARAFAAGTHIFLASGERPTDVALMAHEVAHVVQQRGTPGPGMQLFSRTGVQPLEREAHHASAAVVQRRPFTVTGRTRPRIQRLGIRDALDFFADKANYIPGYRMLTIIIGVNPINMSSVDRSAANILRAIVEFIPGGALITQALDAYGVFEKAGAWVEGQLKSLGLTAQTFKDALDRFLDSLSWSDIFHLGDLWDRAKAIFETPISRLIDFVISLGAEILRMIKDAILKPLAALASQTQGWDLLKAVLGKDPITGEPVPRTAETLIGGFMKLIGQDEVWQNIQRANAIPRAWAWFQGALEGVLAFVRAIPTMFIDALRSLEIADIVVLPLAFAKVGRVFVGFVGNFLSLAGGQVLELLKIIFEVVAPGVMPYIQKAMGAFRTIIRNPIGFIGNLVRAGVQGFRQFAANFLQHLRASLIQWLTGTLSGAGVYIPQAFTLMEIIKFVLSVLGLTWQNIRTKLVRATSETFVAALETGFDIVVTLVREGPAAAWQKIQESLTNLREMVMEQVLTFVRDQIVQAAITRLVTSLNPAGAFIQAIIAIYNTIMFVVERLQQIARVVAAFIDSIAAIAAGNIGSAANRVETTMEGLLTLVISFLARLVGLGRVSDAVVNIVNRIRAPIDRALDRVVAWIVGAARRLGRFVAQAGVPQDPQQRIRLASQAAVAAARRLTGGITQVVLQPVLGAIATRYGAREVRPYQRGGNWWVHIAINPETDTDLGVASGGAPAGGTAAGWPQGVAVGRRIHTPEAGARLAEIVTVATDTMTYRWDGGTVTTSKSRVTAGWGSSYRPGSESDEQRREEIMRVHGPTVGPIVWEAVQRRGDLAANPGLRTAGQAHHIIPVELLTRDRMLGLLVASGWDFNGAVNGIALAAGFHGNHPNYTRYVNGRITAWKNGHT